MTENVRKVFDMLGIKPYEKFKLKIGEDCFYYFDEKLNGFKELRDEDRFCLWYSLLGDCLNYTENIIKLPKKKHVGDLICKKLECRNCPLYSIDCYIGDSYSNLYKILEFHYNQFKDKEIYDFLKKRLDEEVEE